MRMTLPGRSAGWTPPANACLGAGSIYRWFMRELNAAGAPIGAWSPGLAFRVATPTDTTNAAHGQTGDQVTAVAATSSGAPPDHANGNPPPSVQDQLTSINAKLDSLLSPVSLQACGELGIEAELHTAYGGDLDGEFEGRVGAEGFGNGVMGKVKAKPSWGFGAQVKGGFSPKVAFCYDLLDLVDRLASPSSASPTSGTTAPKMAAVAGLSASDTSALTDKLLSLVSTLNLNGERLTQAMDLVPQIGSGADPWSGFRPDGPVARLAQVMPLPGTLGEILKDPDQIIANFRSELALCSNGNLPPAIANVVGEFCNLANNERFSSLLDRVDKTVSTVNTTVNAVRTKVEDVLDQLPTGDDCKFFCK